MRIRQHVSFSIASDHVPPDEISRRIGLRPDRALERGSRSEEPPRPVRHLWEIVCGDPGLPVDQQATRVLARLSGARSAIRDLARGSDDVSAELGVVRYFNADDGEEEDLGPVVDGLEKLAGQHQLLGWHFTGELLDFLRDVGAELDVDEYDHARWKENFAETASGGKAR